MVRPNIPCATLIMGKTQLIFDIINVRNKSNMLNDLYIFTNVSSNYENIVENSNNIIKLDNENFDLNKYFDKIKTRKKNIKLIKLLNKT